jgi:Protein of unknown function (DUF3300)
MRAVEAKFRVIRRRRLRSFGIGLLVLVMLALGPAGAQPATAQPYSQDELDQLLAPIALYPDQLLTQVLIAATYPLEVVEAARFVSQNPDLQGEALDDALSDKNWDPSVKSLAAFPQVLAMMDDRLDWTQRLGDAFLADEQRVMDTVQSLRQRAQAAGNLQSTPQESVIDQGGEILIEPVEPDVIYVPVYNPLFVYGPWWAPDYVPWFWYPPPIFGYSFGVIATTHIFFGRPCHISRHHWGWAHPDWHGHRVVLNAGDNRFWNNPGRPPPVAGGTWQHSPYHRRGVAYPDVATRDRYLRVDPNAVRARREFRGYEPVPRPPSAVGPSPRPMPQGAGSVQRAPGTVQPAPRPPQLGFPRPAAPTFDPGVSRQQAEANAQRGMQSRQSIGRFPAPSMPGGPGRIGAPQAGHAPSAPPAPRGGAPAPRGGVVRQR